MSRILKLFTDVNMNNGHSGLTELARLARVKVADLKDDDLLMFLNKDGDKLKLLGAKGLVIGYLRMPKNRPIMKEALQYIPLTFGSKGFDYDQACKIALQKRLKLEGL